MHRNFGIFLGGVWGSNRLDESFIKHRDWLILESKRPTISGLMILLTI